MATSSTAEDETAGTAARPDSKRRSVASRIWTVIASVLVVVILAAAAFAAVALSRGTWMVTPVLSGSMRPGLAVGGVVISELVPVDSLAVRDVIVFRRPDDPSVEMVHRIVRIRKGSAGKLLINTQGDANTVRDPWTLTIQGNQAYRVRWSVPLLGYVAVAFQNHRGIALLVAGVVLLVIAASMLFSPRRREGRHRRHRRNRRKQGRRDEPLQADETPDTPALPGAATARLGLDVQGVAVPQVGLAARPVWTAPIGGSSTGVPWQQEPGTSVGVPGSTEEQEPRNRGLI